MGSHKGTSTGASRAPISVKHIALIGMLCAVAYLVMLLKNVPPLSVIVFAGFLTFDIKDVIIVMSGFMLGPVSALIISVIVSFIEMITVSDTIWWGFLMNVVSTCAFVLPASLFYKFKHNRIGALIGLLIGIVTVTIVMLPMNYIITPIYRGAPREVVAGMLLPVFAPFNLIKGAVNAALTFLLYKPLVKALRRARLLDNKAIRE